MTREVLDRIEAEFARLRVLVIGDFCLDRWCKYDPALACPSRETGIPRVAVVSYSVTAGAGGTVANNLVALGAGKVEIIGTTGDDANGHELERALRQQGIATANLLRDSARQTFTYTKVINAATGQEDRPRLDFVNDRPPSAEAEAKMIAAFEEHIPHCDAIIVADQSEIPAGSAITPRVRQALLQAARRFAGKIFVADSRAQVEAFPGFVVKPNEGEARQAAARLQPGAEKLGIEPAAEIVWTHLGRERPMYVTLGPAGALLFGGEHAGDGPRLIPAFRDDHPVDICGAGDAFEAGLALALAATQRIDGHPDYVAAAAVGHLAAAVTITKSGTGTASPDELRAKLAASK